MTLAGGKQPRDHHSPWLSFASNDPMLCGGSRERSGEVQMHRTSTSCCRRDLRDPHSRWTVRYVGRAAHRSTLVVRSQTCRLRSRSHRRRVPVLSRRFVRRSVGRWQRGGWERRPGDSPVVDPRPAVSWPGWGMLNRSLDSSQMVQSPFDDARNASRSEVLAVSRRRRVVGGVAGRASRCRVRPCDVAAAAGSVTLPHRARSVAPNVVEWCCSSNDGLAAGAGRFGGLTVLTLRCTSACSPRSSYSGRSPRSLR